jgi:hypothetical protein
VRKMMGWFEVGKELEECILQWRFLPGEWELAGLCTVPDLSRESEELAWRQCRTTGRWCRQAAELSVVCLLAGWPWETGKGK